MRMKRCIVFVLIAAAVASACAGASSSPGATPGTTTPASPAASATPSVLDRLNRLNSLRTDQAAALASPRPLTLPDRYTLNAGYPQATACGGVPSGLTWEYGSSSADAPALVTIARSTARYDTTDAPASRVSVREIGGRQGVLVSPLTADGMAQTMAVYFPEPFGMTAIYAFSISQDDLLGVAAAVAVATR